MRRRSRKERRTDRCETHGAACGASDQRSDSGESPGQSLEAEAASIASGPPSSPSNRKTGRFRGWRGWVLRLSLFLLSPILFFGLLEAGLRLGGYGDPTGFFIEADVGGTYTTNDRFGWRFFPRSLSRSARPCVLSAKPAGSVRIFVLGGSAAMGFPDPSFSFGRILAVMLREQYPGMQFEVVNGAMTAINSHVTLEIARDCAAHEPDLFVVYLGNNEVVGPYGPGTVFQKWSPSLRLVRTSLWAKSTRGGQLLGDVAGYFHRNEGTPGRWLGMEMFLNNPVTADDPRLTAVYDNYQRNLTDICGVARRVRAPVILSTVAVNLRECPPFSSLHRSDLTPEELTKWKSIYEAGGELESGNRWQEAVERYEAAAKIDDRFAELHFRIGQCLMKASRFAEARDQFALARDLDVLRFRADSRINAIIREVAAKQETAGVRLVDAELAFAESDPDSKGIPGGGDLFYEHVHMTFEGNYLLARSVLDQACAALPQLAALRKHGAVPSRQRCAELLALTPWAEYTLAARMVDTTSRAPFTNQFNHGVRQAAARQRRDELRSLASTPQAIEAAWSMYETALAKSPDDWCLHDHFGVLATQSGRPEVAVEHLRIAVERMPYRASLYTNLGAALDAQGHVDEAIAHYQKALRIDPDDAMAHYNLGNTLARRGQVDEAIAHYETALEIEPDNAMAHYGLGSMLAVRGQVDEAMAHYQTALEIQPDSVMVHCGLGNLLAVSGQVDEAIAHYQTALEINPNLAGAHNDLGMALARRGQGDEAITHYEKAVKINPNEMAARRNLEVAQSERESILTAIAERRELLRSHPKDANLLNETALLLATVPHASARNGQEAVELAQRAIALSDGKRPEIIGTLAAAYAETGQFAEAVQTASKAVNLATQQNRPALAEAIQGMIRAYEAGTPIRESPPSSATRSTRP